MQHCEVLTLLARVMNGGATATGLVAGYQPIAEELMMRVT